MVVVALLLIPPTLYVAGYFALGKPLHYGDAKLREYPYDWMALMYEPAGDLEGALTGEVIGVVPDNN